METRNEPFYPDGLPVEDIEALLIEAEAWWSAPPRATSALMDGSAAEQRRRRIARRAVSAVVRSLPLTAALHVTTDSEVA